MQMQNDDSSNKKNETFVREEVKQEVYIMVCGVIMWCITLKSQSDRERWFRLKQLLQVLQQLNIENNVFKTELYYLMINTTYRHTEFRITKNLYETMVRF